MNEYNKTQQEKREQFNKVEESGGNRWRLYRNLRARTEVREHVGMAGRVEAGRTHLHEEQINEESKRKS